MQCTMRLTDCQRRWGAVAHTIAVLGLVVLTAAGVTLESVGGWVTYPPPAIVLAGVRRVGHKRWVCRWGFIWRMAWAWLGRSWMVAAVRSEALMVLLDLNERQEWGWV